MCWYVHTTIAIESSVNPLTNRFWWIV